ncbi:hypothetical protein ACJRO7_015357 [Eucalyptus globulus]|uniref:Uncharacterized protein n=1 Tax=Eucalyptus globulus TaxID=34317 RepID=A0ABD3LDS1_EUCGL
MPSIPVSPISYYGALVVLEGEHHEFIDLEFLGTMFVRYTAVLLVDTRQLDLISYRFVAIVVLVDGYLEGPLPFSHTLGVGNGNNTED